MKKPLFSLACLILFQLSAATSEITFENDQIRATKIKLEAHEEIDLQHNDHPKILISLKGCTLTRIEMNGTKTEIKLPKNTPIYQEEDPANESHKLLNNTCKSLEIIAVEIKSAHPA